MTPEHTFTLLFILAFSEFLAFLNLLACLEKLFCNATKETENEEDHTEG